jgi:thioredoxin 1
MSDLVKHFSEETFTQSTSKGVVVVDFFATWCGPCRMLAPILEQLAEFYKGKVIVGKIDVDAAQEIAATFQVASIPTVILLKDGKEINRLVGLRDLESLKEFVETGFKG